MKCTTEQFVAAWMESTNIAQVTASTGLAAATVTAYASKLRRIGVKLPKMKAGAGSKAPPDVAALNRIVKAASK